MSKQVLYFYFGRQCPGFYMGEQARRAADLLGYAYSELDISHRSDIAEQHNLFCAGTIIIDGFHLHFPARPEQLVESYLAQGPLPGRHNYAQLPSDEVDDILPLTPDTLATAFGLCIPSLTGEQLNLKRKWLDNYPQTRQFGGLIGFKSGIPVAFIEVLRETQIPYPTGGKRPDHAFITCVYSPNEWGLERDYRPSLLKLLVPELKHRGYTGLSVISGLHLPYPNGPEAIFASCGFERVKRMGPVLLRHSWDEAWLMRLKL